MRKIAASCLALTLVACSDDSPKLVETIPFVKVVTVSDRSAGQIRQISGKVEAANIASLSFPIAGTISEILADPGQSVSSGQVLARLDADTYKLALDSANARLASARANLAREQENLRRQRTLFEKKLVAQAALEKAEASFAAAKAQLNTAQSDLSKARLDVDHTALLAPFDGVIAERKAEKFKEVQRAEVVYVLQSASGLKIKVLVPETMIRQIDFGQAVEVSFPTLQDRRLGGVITEISYKADAGNAFPVSVALAAPDADLRPGMSARVTFQFQRNDGKSGFLIPLSAIVPRQASDRENITQTRDGRKAKVFVLDGEANVVRERVVRVGSIRGNLLEVLEGLKAGENIVVAGVAFLHDGMRARRWVPRDL